MIVNQDVASFESSPELEPISKVSIVVGKDADGVEQTYRSIYDETAYRPPSEDISIFSTTKKYAVNEYCVYDDYVYRCSTAITSPGAWDSSKWTLISEENPSWEDIDGYELSTECPWGTQDVANNLLESLCGIIYRPYIAGDATIDPLHEIGDYVYISDVLYLIYEMETTFDILYTSNISAPNDEEIDHEYPYHRKENQEIKRQAATITSSFRVEMDNISSEVSGKIDGTSAQSMINQTINGITLSVSNDIDGDTSISLTNGSVTINSNTVSLHALTADSIVANASITSPTIIGGKFYSSANGPYAIVSEHSAFVDFKLVHGNAVPFEIYEDVGYVTIRSYDSIFLTLHSPASGIDYLGIGVPFVLASASNVNYGSETNMRALQNVVEGQLFFVVS